MHVRVLGEIEVEGDEPIALGGPTQQRVLAALALHRGEVVSVSHLVEVVWPDREPPARAEHNVRTYVHRLRTSLANDGDRVETVGAGYRLRLDVDELDAAQFEQLADVGHVQWQVVRDAPSIPARSTATVTETAERLAHH